MATEEVGERSGALETQVVGHVVNSEVGVSGGQGRRTAGAEVERKNYWPVGSGDNCAGGFVTR